METRYEQYVRSKSRIRFLLGCLIRLKTHLLYVHRIKIARRRGATVGASSVIPLALAKRANSNLIVGDHTTIQTSNLDLRNSLVVGNQVVIGGG